MQTTICHLPKKSMSHICAYYTQMQNELYVGKMDKILQNYVGKMEKM